MVTCILWSGRRPGHPHLTAVAATTSNTTTKATNSPNVTQYTTTVLLGLVLLVLHTPKLAVVSNMYLTHLPGGSWWQLTRI